MVFKLASSLFKLVSRVCIEFISWVAVPLLSRDQSVQMITPNPALSKGCCSDRVTSSSAKWEQETATLCPIDASTFP